MTLGFFLTHVTTFFYLHTALTTYGDEILMTLKTNGDFTLMTLTTSGEDTLTTPVVTCDHFVTAPYDITDNPCDNIDDQQQLAGSNT